MRDSMLLATTSTLSSTVIAEHPIPCRALAESADIFCCSHSVWHYDIYSHEHRTVCNVRHVTGVAFSPSEHVRHELHVQNFADVAILYRVLKSVRT